MPHDVTCPKCKCVFPVTQARQIVGIDCLGCNAGLSVEFKKRPAPIDPGVPPYEAIVKVGKPAAGSGAYDAAKRKRRDEDDEDSSGGGGKGSMTLVYFAALGAMLMSFGVLGGAGYVFFTNLDTSDATINKLNNVPQNPQQQHNNQGGQPGRPSIPGTPPQPKKTGFELKPVTGPIPPIVPKLEPEDAVMDVASDVGSKVGSVAVAGAGRYIVMHFPDSGKLGILDVTMPREIATFPADTGPVKMTAGLSKLVLLTPDSNIFRVYNIPNTPKTLEKLFDASGPKDGVGAIAMGSRTNGPVVGIGTFGGIRLFDLTNSSITEVEEAKKDNMEMFWNGGVLLRGTPDGMGYVSCEGFDKGKRIKLGYAENGKQWKRKDMQLTPFPGLGPDGNVLLYGNGAISNMSGNQLKTGGVGAASGEWYVPAVSGTTGAFLKVLVPTNNRPGKKTLTVTIHKAGNASTPVEGAPTFSALPEFEGIVDPFGNLVNDRPLDRHFFLVPEAKLLVILSGNKDKILLKRVVLN